MFYFLIRTVDGTTLKFKWKNSLFFMRLFDIFLEFQPKMIKISHFCTTKCMSSMFNSRLHTVLACFTTTCSQEIGNIQLWFTVESILFFYVLFDCLIAWLKIMLLQYWFSQIDTNQPAHYRVQHNVEKGWFVFYLYILWEYEKLCVM